MKIYIASIGDKIEFEKIYYNNLDDFIHKKQYNSQLLDIVDSNTIKVAMPMARGQTTPLVVGEEYVMYIYSQKGIYMCRTIVKSREKEKKLPIIISELLSDLVKVQRRQFYRLHINFDVEFHVSTSGELKIYTTLLHDRIGSKEEKDKLIQLLIDLQRKNRKKGLVLDISGGGMRFQSKEPLIKDDYINLFFKLNVNKIKKDFNLQALVIDSSRSLDKTYAETNVYENRVQFINLTKEDREDIIRFIFYKQRKQRQREKT